MDLIDIPINLIIGICSGVIAAIFTAFIVYSIQIKRQFNALLKNLFREIDLNKTKIKEKFDGDFCITQNNWLNDFKGQKKKEAYWIPNKCICEGYQGFLYNYLNFTYYNLFQKSLFIMYFSESEQSDLNLLYYSMKHFCAETQRIEQNINALITDSINQKKDYSVCEIEIKKCFDQIKKEKTDLLKIFNDYPQYTLKKCSKYKLNYWKPIEYYLNR